MPDTAQTPIAAAPAPPPLPLLPPMNAEADDLAAELGAPGLPPTENGEPAAAPTADRGPQRRRRRRRRRRGHGPRPDAAAPSGPASA
jgi:hypothetical protein